MYTHDTHTPSKPTEWRAGPERATAGEWLRSVRTALLVAVPAFAFTICVLIVKFVETYA